MGDRRLFFIPFQSCGKEFSKDRLLPQQNRKHADARKVGASRPALVVSTHFFLPLQGASLSFPI